MSVVPPKTKFPIMMVLPFNVVDAKVVEPVEISDATLDVEAFVVDAFKTAKFAVVPNKVPIVAKVKFAIAA